MIVQCDKCETKFRIADEKVAGGGVKVRCSKCAHVFVVRKDPLGASAGTPSMTFGETGGTTVKVSADALATLAGSSMAPNLSRAPTVPLSQQPRTIPPAASTQQVAAALGFGSAPPRAPVPAFTTHSDAQRPSGLPSGLPNGVPVGLSGGLPAFPDSTKRELPAFPDASSAPTSSDRFPEPRPSSEMKTEQMKLPKSKRDPFHDFAPPPNAPPDPFTKQPSAPGYFPPPGNEMFPKVPSNVSDPFQKIGSDPVNNPFAKIPSNPFENPDPFGAVSPSDPYPVPSNLPRGKDPFADASTIVPPRQESNPFQNPPAPGPDMLQRGIAKTDSKQSFFPPPPDFGKPKSDKSNVPDPNDHDPFADIDVQIPTTNFDDDSYNSAPPPPKPAMPEALGRIQFGLQAPIERLEVSHAKTAVAAAYRDEEEEEEKIGLWPTLFGVAVGLLVALFVFPGLLGDWMDLRIGTELIQPKKLLPESLDYVNPMGARVTSYDGRNGARMLVVSGVAHNQSAQKVENIQAVVLMMEGEDIVERRRAFVGVTLDEATLASVENAAALETAYRNAKQAAPHEQLEIAPGANSRFVVVFPEIPDQIETRKFRVEFVKAPLESANKTEPTP